MTSDPGASQLVEETGQLAALQCDFVILRPKDHSERGKASSMIAAHWLRAKTGCNDAERVTGLPAILPILMPNAQALREEWLRGRCGVEEWLQTPSPIQTFIHVMKFVL